MTIHFIIEDEYNAQLYNIITLIKVGSLKTFNLTSIY